MHLTLHLTRACNLRCDYCYAPPQADDGMSLATGQQALQFGARLNHRIVRHRVLRRRTAAAP